MTREGLSYRFTRAIARRPAESVVKGLRAFDLGPPDHDKYLREHDLYLDALRTSGLEVKILPPLEDFPDSVFVEDTALCLPEGVIILRPGTPTRRDEAAVMAADCMALGLHVLPIDGDGSVDGGDILVTDREILVGASARTNRPGFDALSRILDDWGYHSRLVQTPKAVLHFKSDCAVLDSNTILATSRLASADCFKDYNVLEVPRGEEAAANAIRVNETVFMATGFTRTADMLSGGGYMVKTLPVSQAALLDGGLSCQSLRF